MHRLTNVNRELALADCTVCGPQVPIRVRVRNGKPAQGCLRGKPREYPNTPGPHGLTRQEARAFVQGKACRICGSERRLVVDHDHATGVIRGVLCTTCNSGIGLLKDDPSLLRAAIVYLEAQSPA